MRKKPLFGDTNSVMQDDVKYSRSVKIPQYVPKDNPPPIDALCSTDKYVQLLRDINNSNVSEEEKQFLRRGASRHFVFDYEKIADYYASASPEMQKLMEDSALVMIDINDAIADGYVKMSKRLEAIRNDGNLAKRAKDFE